MNIKDYFIGIQLLFFPPKNTPSWFKKLTIVERMHFVLQVSDNNPGRISGKNQKRVKEALKEFKE